MTSVQKRAPRSMPLRELTGSAATPIALVAANLMPPEVIAKRRLSWLKRRLGFALLALVVVVALGYMLVLQSTSASRDDLTAAQDQTGALQRRITSFADVVHMQGETAQIRTQLATLTAGDLSWSRVLGNLGRGAPKGVSVTGVTAEVVTAANDPASQPGAYAGDGAAIAKLNVSGTAKDYRSVTVYADALTKIKGFGSVEPGSLGSDDGRTTFSLTVSVTKAALGGRYTPSGSK